MNSLHRELYQLLCEIDDICRENKITYYLHGGSVIGAVRHGGIIPWDDDVDVAMTLENYKKFKQALKTRKRPNRVLVNIEDHKNSLFPYAQYKDTTTTVLFRSGLFPDYPNGLFVDIIILDAVGENEQKRLQHIENLKALTEITCEPYVNNRATDWKRYKWHLLQKQLFGKAKTIQYLVKRLEQGNTQSCAGYIQRVGIYPVFWDKKFFQEPEYFWFGPRKFPTPSNTYEYLRYTYGDAWMKYPDNRDGHGFLYSTSFSFQTIQNEYKNAIDHDRYAQGWLRYKHWRIKAIPWEETIRICNSKRIASIRSLALYREISDEEILSLYKNQRFSAVLHQVRFYLDNQLQNRFTKDAISFQVSDTVLYVTCMSLIFSGKYDIAYRFIQINENNRDKYPSFGQLEKVIEQSRELSIAYYEGGRDWQKIERLANIGLEQYPQHADFIAAKCDALLHMSSNSLSTAKIVQEICKKGLHWHPINGHLRKCLADAQMILQQRNKAITNYQHAFHITNDGMLRQEIQTIAKGNSFVIEEQKSSTHKVSDWYRFQVQQAQNKILKMLREIDQICKRENIPYFLGGYLASEAVELKTFAPECCSAYLVMRPSDRKRFLAAVEQECRKNRTLESFENNPNYPDFSIRYCDTSTTWFDLKTEGFYMYPALHVDIYFLRTETQQRFFEWIKVGTTAAIEACAFPRIRDNHTTRKRKAGILGRIFLFVFGKKRGKELAWTLIYHPQSTETQIKGSIKSYWFKEIRLPILDFSQHKLCRLDGQVFPVPVNTADYLAPQVARNWNNGKPVGLRPLGDNIVEMNVPCALSLQALNKLHLKQRHFHAWRMLNDYNRRCSKESAYTKAAWQIALRVFDRYTLWERFHTQKQKIMDLRAEENFQELEVILKPYLDRLRYHTRYKQPLAFDNDILRIAWELLDRKGEGRVITSVLPKMPQNYYLPIQCQIPVKITVGGMAMKKAIDSEQEQILNYLEQDVANCLYIYADISKYGVDGPNIKVWYNTDEAGIRMVVMKYHNNFQIYSNRGFDDIAGILELIDQEQPINIAGREELINCLDKKLDDRYQSEYGVIFKGKSLNLPELNNALESCTVQLERATEADAQQIAELICLDEELGQAYTEESLTQEMEERIRTGMGRSYVIRDGNRIVAHNATYAECSKFVVISGFMVHPNYRNTEYAYWIDVKSGVEFQEEGKDRYFLALKKKIIRWHKYVGSTIVAQYGKLSLRNKCKK